MIAIPKPGRISLWARRGAAAAAILFAGCFTEIGNPGKEPIEQDQIVSARFRIDYERPAAKAAKAPKASALGIVAAPDSLRILAFTFNVVEVNYTALDETQGRIWKVPDSLGKRVDFTGADKDAVLPPIAVPATDYSILKLESRIPRHPVLDPDTVAFGSFTHGAYIKGVAYYSGRPVRFLCQFTDDYKINLVYARDILELWRQGASYNFDFVFYAAKWISGADLSSITPVTGADGAFVLIDQEHSPESFTALKAAFFKSFNSTSVWKENPAP